MARVARGHGGELIVNLQCNGSNTQQQQQEQRNADCRTAKQQRSFERSEASCPEKYPECQMSIA